MESKLFKAKLGRRFKYPYDVWFDGNERVLTRPADFQVPPESLCCMLRARARKIGGQCTAIPVGESSVRFRFITPDEPKPVKRRPK